MLKSRLSPCCLRLLTPLESWVFSQELSQQQIGNHSIYDPSKSTTAKHQSGLSWNISYGDGSGASGDVYTDTVTVGGATVTNQAVETANNVSSEFIQDFSNSGLLGLAFDSLNTGKLVEPRSKAR